jgi:hypothetical protein
VPSQALPGFPDRVDFRLAEAAGWPQPPCDGRSAAADFRRWLAGRPERTIAVVSHSHFLKEFLELGRHEVIDNCAPIVVEMPKGFQVWVKKRRKRHE